MYVSIQNRLERAAQDCQDKVRDKFTGKSDFDTRTDQEQLMKSCIAGQINEHIKMLPTLRKRIDEHCKKFI